MIAIILVSLGIFSGIWAQNLVPLKAYSCTPDGSCLLNPVGVQGLNHQACLISCGSGIIWPAVTGKLEVGSQFAPFDLNDITFSGDHLSNFDKFVSNFLLNVPKGKSSKGAGLFIHLKCQDITTTTPSIDNDESYSISISYNSLVEVSISGNTVFGIRHGLETLSQLVYLDEETQSPMIVTSAYIEDAPSFNYRGVMVDVTRNFISMDKLKETIKAMGSNKMNVLHLHLSDTASFPVYLESQKNVTKFGAYDSLRYYSTKDLHDLEEYATGYGVMILPEIDTPAHVSAGWQWGEDAGLGSLILCADPDGVKTTQWTHTALEPPSGQLNIANENIYRTLQDIYTEIIQLFPTGYFHLGGDEVIIGSDESNKACYNSSTLAQPILAKLQELGLDRNSRDSFYQLWENFTMRATELVQNSYQYNNNSRMRKREDSNSSEILSSTQDNAVSLRKIHIWGGAGLDPTGTVYNLMTRPNLVSILPPQLFTIQVWDTTDASISKELIDKGYDIVLSNTDYVYLDCGNAGFTNPGGYWCQPYHEWYHIYSYIQDIIKKWALSTEEMKKIRGSETLIWTEMVDDANLSHKLWPRSAALAEALWSNPTTTTWYNAAERMLHWRNTLVERGIQAEALLPRWCLQRDAKACYQNVGTPQ